MIIPIRCFTCGKAIAPIYLKYIDETKKIKNPIEETINDDNILKKSEYGKLLDKLHINRLCCRTIFLSHIELIDIIEP